MLFHWRGEFGAKSGTKLGPRPQKKKCPQSPIDGGRPLKTITLIYILNATLLLLHEIESAYEKEWEILKLPGEITGFLLLHIPMILVLFYGLIEISTRSAIGLVIGVVSGIGGLIPFFVHNVFVRRPLHFNRWISKLLIYLNFAAGMILIFISASCLI